MKNVISIASILFLLVFSGCEKESVKTENLEGSWELRHVLGVQVAGAPSDFDKGNGSIIKFSGNEYQRIESGEMVRTGTYKIVKESAEIDGTKYTDRIIFDDDEWKTFIKLSGKKLLLSIGSIAHDGATSTYEKIR